MPNAGRFLRSAVATAAHTAAATIAPSSPPAGVPIGSASSTGTAGAAVAAVSAAGCDRRRLATIARQREVCQRGLKVQIHLQLCGQARLLARAQRGRNHLAACDQPRVL